jgi:excinuclease ABC subunit A
VDIPRDALVVFTGGSGSGKSSLAFGTPYAKAQRRCLESVAPSARRLSH